MLKKYLDKFKEVWEATNEEYRPELISLMKGYMIRVVIIEGNWNKAITQVEELFTEQFDDLITSWEAEEPILTEKKSAYATYNEMYL